MSLPLRRGDVWLADFDPSTGTEQAGRRPALIVSVDTYNMGLARRVMMIPLSSTIRPIRWHVPITPPEGGVRRPSAILVDQARTMAVERLLARWGAVLPVTLEAVAERLRVLLGI